MLRDGTGMYEQVRCTARVRHTVNITYLSIHVRDVSHTTSANALPELQPLSSLMIIPNRPGPRGQTAKAKLEQERLVFSFLVFELFGAVC